MRRPQRVTNPTLTAFRKKLLMALVRATTKEEYRACMCLDSKVLTNARSTNLFDALNTSSAHTPFLALDSMHFDACADGIIDIMRDFRVTLSGTESSDVEKLVVKKVTDDKTYMNLRFSLQDYPLVADTVVMQHLGEDVLIKHPAEELLIRFSDTYKESLFVWVSDASDQTHVRKSKLSPITGALDLNEWPCLGSAQHNKAQTLVDKNTSMDPLVDRIQQLTRELEKKDQDIDDLKRRLEEMRDCKEDYDDNYEETHDNCNESWYPDVRCEKPMPLPQYCIYCGLPYAGYVYAGVTYA
jgi:hypothetical protein